MNGDRPATSTSVGERESGTTRRTALKTLGAAGAALLAGCTVSGEVERETTTEEHAVAGSDVDELSVSGGDGETVVRGWDGTDVAIEATKYAIGKTDLSDVTVTTDVVGGELEIEAEVPDEVGIGAFGGGFEELEVKVPAGTRVSRVDIDDGEGQVSDVAGDVTLDVDDGTAEVGPVDGRVDVSVDDGTVTLGAVDAATGDVDDGTIELTEPTTLGDFEADDGVLDLAVGGLDGDVTVQADDGDVTAEIAGGIDASVVVRGDDGDVQFEGDGFDSVSSTDERTSAEVGDGGDQLTIDVDDADVHVDAV